MGDRLFLLDKNYLLKQAQNDLQLELQVLLVDKVKEGYFALYNPLKLRDETTEVIEDFRPIHFSLFDELYDILCGIYRFQIGDNQLEFLFDGSSHYDKYLVDWKENFIRYVDQLCTRQNFIIAGLELSVYYDPERRSELAQNRMKLCVYSHFGLKLYKYKGIQKYDARMA